MGAMNFSTIATGKTAAAAFIAAVRAAQYERGHGGYTGTIAEKHEFRLVTPPPGVDPLAWADQLMDDDTHWVQNKWGPAACVDLGGGRFCFFGWASH